jgi:isoleucyl-tRNA synthetase
MFTKAGALDFVAIQRDVLEFWARHDVFAKLVARNRGGPRYSFIDGPITANNPMGVHHARGRTYKDLFQRYRAMRGFEQRFQNGFDCHGLWVEVEVEKALGLGGKRAIEAMGLARFARACRERVERLAAEQTEQSRMLGQWMDWPQSYFTMADRNIEYIWHFLHECHDRGWIYQGHQVMPWCVRCGTSISQHEMLEAYVDVTHPSLVVALPLVGAARASLLVWTTTAWTLPANVAVALNPELDYEAVAVGDRLYYVAATARPRFPHLRDVRQRLAGGRLVGLRYHGPFPELPAQKGVEHRVVAWDQVSAEDGTGLVHIAPGCGQEDFDLGRREGLLVLAPLDDEGRYLESFGRFAGRDALGAGDDVIDALRARGFLYEQRPYRHRYPTCWRCGTELLFRLTDEWFIRVDDLRPRARTANAAVRWYPEYMRRRMDDWLTNMTDWCISRKRYWGVPLPFYPCPACERLTVVSSRQELAARAVDPATLDALPELHRPWIDGVAVHCPACGHEARRVDEVGDCWLDAGIVPFSTLGYLDDRNHWARWFPADFVVEMAGQLRGWFYALLVMAVTLEGQAPYRTVMAHDKVLGADGREMHKSWGNAVWLEDAVGGMGADVIRYLFASSSVTEPLRFEDGAGREVKRKFLTLWNVYTLFLTYAGLDHPELPADAGPPAEGSGLDRWVLARLQSTVGEVGTALDAYQPRRAVLALEEFIQQDLSNWYVRRRRRLFWKGEMSALKTTAYGTLYHVLVRACQLLAPVTPFVAEHMYRTLVRKASPAAPLSVHLTAFPTPDPQLEDLDLEAEVALVRRILRVGLAARNAARIKVRQPLARAIVHTGSERWWRLTDFEEDLREELNVEAVETVPSLEDLRAGADVASASEAGVTVALDTTLTPALKQKGLVRHVVHQVQLLRKSVGLNVEERIRLFVDADAHVKGTLDEYRHYVLEETLAVDLLFHPAPAGTAVQEVSLDGSRAVLGVRSAAEHTG